MSANCVTYYDKVINLPIANSLPSDLLSCIGYNKTLSEWNDILNKDDCESIMVDYIYDNNNQVIQKNYDNLRNGFEYAFSNYYYNQNDDPKRLVNPNQVGYNNVQDLLLNLCGSDYLGGVCNLVQQKMCNGCDRNDIITNQPLLRFCGCFVKPDLLTTSNNVPLECDPLCAQYQSIKKGNLAVINRCQQSVCIINNISVTAVNSTISNISFNQICPNCREGCRCIIDTSVSNLGEIIGVNNPIVLNQYCGDQSVCLQLDNKTGISNQVECNDFTSIKYKPYSFKVPLLIWIIIIIIIVLFLIVCLYYVNKSKN